MDYLDTHKDKDKDKDKDTKKCPACGGLYPQGQDSESERNGGPKTSEGKPMQSDAEGNGFGEKQMRKKGYAKMLAKKMNED